MFHKQATPSLSLIVPTVLTVVLLVYRVYTYFTHPLRKFPGPFLCTITNAPFSWWSLGGRKDFKILELHQKYGSVVRIAPDELSFDSAQSWKDIYGFRAGHKTFIKSELYDGASSFDGQAHGIITSRDPAEHSQMRRYLSHAFSAQALREQEGLVIEIVDLLIEKMRDTGVKKGDSMNMERWLRMCTFDITGSLAFGRSFDAIKNGGEHPSVKFIHEALRQLSIMDTMRRFPYLGKIFALFFARSLYNLLKSAKLHEQFALRTVRERIASPSKRPDFLTYLQQTLNPSDPQLSDVQVAAHAADILQAGSDTANLTIGAMLYFVFKHPDLYLSLTTEVRTKFSSYESINAQEAAGIPLLKHLILETMRIYPPVPLGLPRLVPSGGDTVDGHFIPEGTTVSTNAFAASMSIENFDSPYEFKPERWEKGSERGYGKDILEASQPFSLGARACIGQNLAWMEMNTIICKILWSFDLELVNKDMDIHRDSTHELLWETPPLWVKVLERVHSN